MPSAHILTITLRGQSRPLSVEPGSMFRVGTDARCEVRLPAGLPGVGGQGVTVECLDDRLTIFNHDATGARLDGVPLAPDEESEWRPGQVVELGPEVRLALEGTRRRADQKPRATDAPAPGAAPEGEPAAPVVGLPPADWVRLGVIVVCALVSGVLLLDPGTTDPGRVREGVKELVAAHQATEARLGPDPIRANFCADIQAARMAALRGDDARPALIRVRNALLHRRRADGTFATDWEHRAFDLVRLMLTVP